MKTRSKGPSKSAATAPPSIPQSEALPPSDGDSPALFILPKGCSSQARVVTLPNPATALATTYYVCPDTGFYEFIKIAAPKRTPRSWLLAPISRENKLGASAKDSQGSENGSATVDGSSTSTKDMQQGYIKSNSDLYITSRMDSLFLILPYLGRQEERDAGAGLYLSMDNYLDLVTDSSKELKVLLRNRKLRSLVEQRIRAVCDVVDAGDESMYRLSHKRLALELYNKARRMSQTGFPPSLEAKFIRSVLEEPVVSVSVGDQVGVKAAKDSGDADQDRTLGRSTGVSTESLGPADASNSVVSEAAVVSSVAQQLLSASQGPPTEIIQLLRLRTALDFLKLSYVPPRLHERLDSTFAKFKAVNFKPLDTHMEHLVSLRSQAHALRSLSDNIHRKRGAAEDDDAAEARAEKKRKKEEEEKKKKMESRAAKDLRKVDTTGMKKLSAFFTKPKDKEKSKT